MAFKDYFSGHAHAYAAFRPTYPAELFEWLAARSPGRALAWDAGTGSGQAAVALAKHFDRVVGTDASERQLSQASPARGVEYRVEPAEATTLAAGRVDLVTVAQAAHWFDLPRFTLEVRRVARPGAVLALWSYDLLSSGLADVDAELLRFYRNEVGPWWPPDRKAVEDGYRGLVVALPELPVPPFFMRAEWTLDELVGYVGTWSSVAGYRAEKRRDPVAPLRERLVPLWGNPALRRAIAWPLAVRAFTAR